LSFLPGGGCPWHQDVRAALADCPGIYLLEDDLFIACIGYQGARPEAFSSLAGGRAELVVYARVNSAGE
jgi:hypothetical protein